MRKREKHLGDRIFKWMVTATGVAVILLLSLIALFLWQNSSPAFHQFGFSFFSRSTWDPVRDIFGILPVIFGTVVSSLIAVSLAAPLSIGVALYLVEFAPPRISQVISFLVQMLAAIPSVVYGLWGIFALAPILANIVEPFLRKYLGFLPLFQGPIYGVGMLAAGIILAIMITPIICSLSVEIFRAIEAPQKEAALALGATHWEMIKIAMLKASKGGLIAAVMLGLGRAFGETMAVTMVIGNRSEISLSLFAPAQTMPSLIANEYAEAVGELHLSALCGVGFALFVVTFVFNSGALFLIKKLTGKKGQPK